MGHVLKNWLQVMGYLELASLRHFYRLKQQGSYRPQDWIWIYKLRVIPVQGFSRKNTKCHLIVNP